MYKTIKQIKNLKAYAERDSVEIWTAKWIGTWEQDWQWGWYDLEEFEKNPEKFFDSTSAKFEFKIHLRYPFYI